MSRAAGLLAVTLRRGLAGKKGTDKATAQVLGLSRTGSTVLVPNTSTNRGQVNKASPQLVPLRCVGQNPRVPLRRTHTRRSPLQLKYLVNVELEEDRAVRLTKAAAKASLRPPLVVHH